MPWYCFRLQGSDARAEMVGSACRLSLAKDGWRTEQLLVLDGLDISLGSFKSSNPHIPYRAILLFSPCRRQAYKS